MASLRYSVRLLRKKTTHNERCIRRCGLAHTLSHPFSLAMALTYAARLHQLRREGPAGQDQAEAPTALCTEQSFPAWLAEGAIFRGWALDPGRGTVGEASTSFVRDWLPGWPRDQNSFSRYISPYWPRHTEKTRR